MVLLSEQFVPVVELCVSSDAPEAAWTVALANRIGGTPEVSVPHGRIDVLSETFAIEVDRITKWHEGIGQSLHYADATGKQPVLALIASSREGDRHLISEIDKLCLKQGIKLVILYSRC